MKGSNAPRENSTLTASGRPAEGLANSGRTARPVTSRSSMIGTATRKTEPHQNHCNNTPPRTGPSATPAVREAAHTEMAMPRCRASRNMTMIRARLEGTIVAPATPSAAREAMSISGEEE